MKKLFTSAAALSLTAVPGLASENDWSQLDQEVEALTSSLQDQDGLHIGGWIRARWDFSGDLETDLVNIDGDTQTQSLNGASVPQVRLILDGETGGYGYFVQYELSSQRELTDPSLPGDKLLDASIDFPIGETIRGTVGQFKPPIVRSALLSRKDIFFLDKSTNGIAWSGRDQGVMVEGEFDALGWWLTLMNGSDGAFEDLFISGRVDFDLMGEGVGNVEGAYGGGDNPSVTAGVSAFSDGFSDDGEGFGADVYASTNIYSFGAELVDYGDSGYFSQAAGIATIGLTPVDTGLGGATPWAISGTYMLTPDTWEVGARYQDLDNDDDERLIEIAVNHYLQGHDLKWQVQYTNFSTDAAGEDDADVISGGIVLAF